LPLKNKLDLNLKTALLSKQYKTYRVLIHCKALPEVVEKKIKNCKGEILRSISSINCISANLTDRTIDRLLEYPEIDYIIFDSYAFLCGSSVSAANGVLFQERYKLTGKGIGVGLIDSGTYPHPDLMDSTGKINNFIDLVNGLKYPYDDNGHGTFMAGIICGNGKSSKGMYRGVAENSHIFSIKCFNSIGKGYVSDILYALETLINNAIDYNLKTLCLPFELTDNSYFILSMFEKLFKKAVENNLVIVVPSGTNGNDESSMRGIATLQNCITVGGIDTRGSQKIYEYSSSGPCGKLEKPDLVAACVDICSLNSNTEYISERNGIKLYTQALEKPYTNFTGTSCSAAYICGLCTLLFENNPNLTYKDVVSLMKVSCEMLPLLKRLQGMGTVNLNSLLP
jgi:serine protease AprX